MSASSLLASLARARFELQTLSLTDLSALRAQAEQDLVDYGPRFELDRQRRLAMRVQHLREQVGFLAAQAAPVSSAPSVLPENTNDQILAQLLAAEASIDAQVLLDEPTIASEDAQDDGESIGLGGLDGEFIDLAQSVESVEFSVGFADTQPLDDLTEIASEEGEDHSASASEIASALGGAMLAAAAAGTLDRELTGLEELDAKQLDAADQLEELSLAELEASDLLGDGSTLEMLGDDDSVDEGSLLSPVDSFDEEILPEDEPVPGSIELQALDSRLHPDALSLDGELLQPVTSDLSLDLGGEDSADSLGELLADQDEDSAFAEAFGDYEDEEDAPGELLDEDDDIEAALFEVAGSRGGGASGQVVREIAEEHRSDELPVMPTIKDRTNEPSVGAAAAIRLNADGSSQALMSDDEENIEVEMPDAGEEYDDEPESEGLNVDYVDEVEYIDDVESAAPKLDVTPKLQTFNDGQNLSGDDFSPVEEVDAVAVAALRAQADEALDRGDLHAAAQAFSDTLEYDPESLEAYLGRGRCYLDLGDFAAAMSDFQKAEDLDGEGPEPLVAMGELFFARKEYTRAIEFFDQAVEMDSDHAMARCRRGISYYYKKSYRQAFLDLQKAYTLDPDIPNIRKYVQMAIKKLERSGESI
ncbi:MAG: thioredoxin-like negative regulator of GroEL [Cognaticolwellia sp.]